MLIGFIEFEGTIPLSELSLTCVVKYLSLYKEMSLQSGGAILGPPGAPGAPVSVVVPQVNPSNCAVRDTSKKAC